MSWSPEHNLAGVDHLKEQLIRGVEGIVLVDMECHCDLQECTVGVVGLTLCYFPLQGRNTRHQKTEGVAFVFPSQKGLGFLS